MIGDPAMIRLSNGNYAAIWDSATQGGGNVRGAIFSSSASWSPISRSRPLSRIATRGRGADRRQLGGGDDLRRQHLSAGDVPDRRPRSAARSSHQQRHRCRSGDLRAGRRRLLRCPGRATTAGGRDLVCGAQRRRNATAGRDADGQLRQQRPARDGGNAERGFAVVYRDSGWSDDGLSLHLFTAAGTQTDGPIRVDPPALSLQIESDPDIAVLSNGMILITWTHPFNPADGGHLRPAVHRHRPGVQVDGFDYFAITGSGTNDTASSGRAAERPFRHLLDRQPGETAATAPRSASR